MTLSINFEGQNWRMKGKSLFDSTLALELFRMELCFPLQQQSVPVYYAMPISNPEKLWSTQCAEGGQFPSKVIITFSHSDVAKHVNLALHGIRISCH